MTTPTAPPFPIYVNGRIQPADVPALFADDEGLLLGLAVFDTVLYEDGCLYFLEGHVDRLRHGALELGIPWPPPWDPSEALRETARALDGRDAALRITLTRGVPGRGATLLVTPRAIRHLPAKGVRVAVSSHKKLLGNELERLKTTNRLRNVLAQEEAQAQGAWEALLANEEGDLTEGTISNLFVVHDGTLRTPPTERGCLGGIIREQILEELRVRPLSVPLVVERVDPEHVLEASEVFLTNTTGRVIPVLEVAGLERPVTGLPGGDGPVAQELRQRLSQLEERYRAQNLNVAS